MEKDLKHSEDNKFIPMTSVDSGKGREARNDVFYYTNQIVNLVMVGLPGASEWVLIDAGMPKSSEDIIKEAAKRFGEGNAPKAIVLTHGHFDHVGSLADLLQEWEVPVYAHPLEHAYLTGKESYPVPDSSVEGGKALARISPMYPHKPIDVTPALQELPKDGSVPGLPDWQWIYTPGHSRGHVSFFRDSDHTLIAGDAFVTVRQDSLYKVLVQKSEVNGPPNYLTTDWDEAWESVKQLHELEPKVAVCGHGPAMAGSELEEGLRKLVQNFDQIIPEYGKYVERDK